MILQFVIAALLGLVAFTDPAGQNLWPWVQSLLIWTHTNRFVIAFCLFAANLAATALYWLGQSSAWHKTKKLHRVLDTVAAQTFCNQGRGGHVHRVTLFKARSCLFCGSWLGMAVRSGKKYPRKRAVFCISPHTIVNNTGIAGECWWRDGQTILIRLPDCRRENAGIRAQKAYIKQGYLDEREMKRMNVRSCDFVATGIRVAGELWGILVIDCTDPDEISRIADSRTPTAEYDKVLSFAAVAIEQLVS